MVHPRLRPRTNDRMARTGINKMRYSTIYNKFRQSTANKTSRHNEFSKEKSAASIRMSLQQLPIPKRKMLGDKTHSGDTSRTDLEVVNPSMHIAEPEIGECTADDCFNLN